MENIPCTFKLTKEETIKGGCNFKTKKVTKRTQILSGKLIIKFAYKQLRRDELLLIIMMSST